MSTLSEKLRELRTEAGLTREKLAERAGVSTAYIYKLEADEYSNLSIDKCHSLAKGLGITFRDFLVAVGLLKESSTPNVDRDLVNALRSRALPEKKIKQVISFVEFIEANKK